MFEKQAEEALQKRLGTYGYTSYQDCHKLYTDGFKDGYSKINEWHSPEEHIYKDKVVLGIIKHRNKSRYSLVQWNGEWWYQYGTYNAEVRLIAWCEIPTFRQVTSKLQANKN